MADEKDIQCIRFIDSAGGTLRSSVCPTTTCRIPEDALQIQMNYIPVSLQILGRMRLLNLELCALERWEKNCNRTWKEQVINVDKTLVQEFLGKGSAISPIVTIEPVRRKFHRSLQLSLPLPSCDHQKVNVQNLKVLFSLSGNGDKVRFEDITCSMPMNEMVSDKTVNFQSVCTGRIVIVSCTNSIIDVVDTMSDLYRKAMTDGYMSDDVGVNKLFKAAKSGDVSLLQEAIEVDHVDIDHQNQDGQTALHIASKEGHISIVKELLSREANCNILSKKCNAPIHLACYYNHKDVLEALLDHGVDVNMPCEGSYPPLYAAIIESNCDIIQLLLTRSPDTTWISSDGLSLIMVALFSKLNKEQMYAMVELLKDNFDFEKQTLGAHLMEKGFKNHGEALLHCLHLRTGKSPGTNVLESVRQKLANLSGSELREDIASIEFAPEEIKECFEAVIENDVERFEVILSKGLDVKSQTERSVTALHIACLHGHQKMVEIVLNVIKTSDISSVSQCICQTVLLNKQTQGGFTALYLAAQEGYKDIVTMLLNAGASGKIVSNENFRLALSSLLMLIHIITHQLMMSLSYKFGLSPNDIAIEMGHTEIATTLRDTKIPRRLFENKTVEKNDSPAITVNKRNSAIVEQAERKEKRKNTNSCSLA